MDTVVIGNAPITDSSMATTVPAGARYSSDLAGTVSLPAAAAVQSHAVFVDKAPVTNHCARADVHQMSFKHLKQLSRQLGYLVFPASFIGEYRRVMFTYVEVSAKKTLLV